MDYLDMVQLEKFAALIATDSGGTQKKAFFHQAPCVTLRDEAGGSALCVMALCVMVFRR